MAIVALVWHGRLVPGRGEVRLVRLGDVRDVKRLEGWKRERERRAGKMERGKKEERVTLCSCYIYFTSIDVDILHMMVVIMHVYVVHRTNHVTFM